MLNHPCRGAARNGPLAVVCLLLFAGTTAYFLTHGGSRPVVVVYTSVDQVFSEPVFRAFEEATGARVLPVFDTEEVKSTGVLNRLLAEAQQPQADVFWSGDPVRPFVLIEKGLVEPFVSTHSSGIPSGFKDPDGAWTGSAARARVLLVHRERLGDRAPPTSVRDLAAPRFRGDAALANPLFGTTTMHVAAWCAIWGEEETRRFLDALKANEVRIAGSNGEVKRLVASGELTLGLTDTDDAFEAVRAGAPVDVVFPDQDDLGVLVMPTSIVLLRNAPHPNVARALASFLVSAHVEEMLAGSSHMPLRADTPCPDSMPRLATLRSMPVDFAATASAMQTIQPWLREWVGL